MTSEQEIGGGLMAAGLEVKWAGPSSQAQFW